VGTIAARGIPGFDHLASLWQEQAPLGWDPKDPGPIASAICFVLSDYSRAITGEIVHVDGGFHALGAPVAPEQGLRIPDQGPPTPERHPPIPE
jgi:enoyl-[acyl-carrier protein] reductase I